MDHNKIKDEYVLMVVVALAGVMAATWYRANAIDKGMDTGTANLVFIMVLVFAAVLYVAIVKILAWLIPMIGRRIPRLRNRFEANRLKNQPEPIVPETQEEEKTDDSPEISIEDIKRDAELRHAERLTQRIKIFHEYTHLTLAPRVTADELARLDNYIELYARDEPLPEEIRIITPQGLSNPDIFHFGWNMANYFGQKKQDVVPWLQKIFWKPDELEYSYIKGQLYSPKTRFTIPNVKDIPKFLEELKGK